MMDELPPNPRTMALAKYLSVVAQNTKMAKRTTINFPLYLFHCLKSGILGYTCFAESDISARVLGFGWFREARPPSKQPPFVVVSFHGRLSTDNNRWQANPEMYNLYIYMYGV